MQLFGIFRSLKFFYIFRSARLSFKAITIGQNSKFFILRARILFLQHQNRLDLLIILHTLFVKIGWKISELWPKTCFRKTRANPYFCTKTAPKNPILKITSPFLFCMVYSTIIHFRIEFGAHKCQNLVLRARKPHFLDKIAVCGKWDFSGVSVTKSVITFLFLYYIAWKFLST